MLRTLILGLFLVATTRGALADETTAATRTPATVAKMAAVTTASVSAGPVDTRKKRSSKPPAGANQADVASDAASTPGPGAQPADVKMSGMSILGNEDTPKSLALVPWKGSQLGQMPSVSRLLDSSAQPVDKDVFMRELAYYEFKSGAK